MYDFCIIGAGIVSLATALKLLAARPDASLLMLEKENDVARHQTSHNSGVIHAGIYYPPGSLKAQLCRRGAAQLRDFADEHDIEYRAVGKLVVALDDRELPGLEEHLARPGLAAGKHALRRRQHDGAPAAHNRHG